MSSEVKLVFDPKQINESLEEFAKKKGFNNSTKVAFFTHQMPDCDAISSLMGICWTFHKKWGVECDMFYEGRISHPQNNAMDNLLDPGLKNIEDGFEDNYDVYVLVDTVPSNAGVGGNSINFDLVIDHHPDLPNGGFNGIVINLKAGSCASTIYKIIEEIGLSFDKDNDLDKKVATALIAGIMTDTENMMSSDTTNYETEAFKVLCDYRDVNILKEIVFFKRPKFWVNAKALAAERAYYDEEGHCIVGMGFLPPKHWDLLADQADEMVQWDTVHTAIAFAAIGDTIVGCVRSANPSVVVKDFCKRLGGKKGKGGGKQGKGRYVCDLGGLLTLDPEENEETKQEIWEMINKRETSRILRILEK